MSMILMHNCIINYFVHFIHYIGMLTTPELADSIVQGMVVLQTANKGNMLIIVFMYI